MEAIEVGTRDEVLEEDFRFNNDKKVSRWSIVDFGLVSTILKLLLVNISEKACGIATILSTTAISIGDTVSDFIVSFTLFFNGHRYWALIVIIIDYLPSWNILAHNVTSSKWREFKDIKEKVITIVFLILSPFSMALFHLRWLLNFETANQDTFDFLHHNARMSQILSGSFESPAQIVLLLILYGEEKLDRPLSDASECIIDSAGRTLCLGVLPGIISFLNSISSILKGSIEISEGKSAQDKVQTLIYAFSNFMFRLPSISILVLFFDEWSVGVLLFIIVTNIVVILRYNEDKRKEFSVISSAIIATISPFVSSDQTNLYKRTDVDATSRLCFKSNIYRKKLSAKVTILTTTCLLMCNLTLLLLLSYSTTFKYRKEVKIEKSMAIHLLANFVLPIGVLTLIINVLYGMKISPNKNQYTNCYDPNYRFAQFSQELSANLKYVFQLVGLILLFCGVSKISISTISGMYQDSTVTNVQNLLSKFFVIEYIVRICNLKV